MIEHLINTRFLQKNTLTKTHRFGKNLSKLLDSYIYHNGFSSFGDNSTQIYYINSKSDPKMAKDRSSKEEVAAIKDLLRDNSFDNDFAILSPYNSQVYLLKKELNKKYHDRILTVHKSQGSEYNTVIFSIVDDSVWGKRGIFFTDSNNKKSNGLNLINTVVSRVKTRLILVGNYDFWILESNQLISGLFKLANRWV
jgi:superfamily I DNA and/or RNA helicase